MADHGYNSALYFVYLSFNKESEKAALVSGTKTSLVFHMVRVRLIGFQVIVRLPLWRRAPASERLHVGVSRLDISTNRTMRQLIICLLKL